MSTASLLPRAGSSLTSFLGELDGGELSRDDEDGEDRQLVNTAIAGRLRRALQRKTPATPPSQRRTSRDLAGPQEVTAYQRQIPCSDTTVSAPASPRAMSLIRSQSARHSFSPRSSEVLGSPRGSGSDLISSSLASTAMSGDIILFQSKGWGTRIQRYLTQSDFDHVGLMLRRELVKENEGTSQSDIDSLIMATMKKEDKISQRGLYVLEAVQGPGVICSPWEAFIENDWISNNQKIVIRQLRCRHGLRTLVQVQRRLWEFARRVVGKRYSLSFKRMLSNLSTESESRDKVPSPLSNRQPSKEDVPESYFCSELVADALRAAGVFEADVKTAGFWPVCFSLFSDYALPLMPGFGFAAAYVNVYGDERTKSTSSSARHCGSPFKRKTQTTSEPFPTRKSTSLASFVASRESVS